MLLSAFIRPVRRLVIQLLKLDRRHRHNGRNRVFVDQLHMLVAFRRIEKLSNQVMMP